MKESEAASRLEEVERLRRRTRARSHLSWIPFFVFGALTLGAIPFSLAGDDGYDGFYWLVAGPLGGAVTAILVQLRSASSIDTSPPMRQSSRRWWAGRW